MGVFHMHAVCPYCSAKFADTTVSSTMSLTRATRVPDGPTDLFPCPVCLEDVIYEIRPGEAEMDDDADNCLTCGWRPTREGIEA